MAAFHIDAGFDFHEAFIDLPRGNFQFIWELQLDQLEPVEIIRSYHAAIDDVEVVGNTCAQLRKFYSNWFQTFLDHWLVHVQIDGSS